MSRTRRNVPPDLGDLAIEIVKAQLSRSQTRSDACVSGKEVPPSLFDASVLRLLESFGDDVEEISKALEALPVDVGGRAAWTINDVPYAMFSHISRRNGFEKFGDLDEWYVVVVSRTMSEAKN